MVFKTLLKFAAGKRIPLIKFRKGGGGSAASAGAAANQGGRASNAAIEDWELPPRYKRKPIDLAEMEYINNGGPV